MNGPRRVMVIGGGAREHALAWRLAAEHGVERVDVAPGNAGTTDVATVWPGVEAGDLAAIVELAGVIQPDLVVVGPEVPLAAGLADRLSAAGVAVFGPTQAAARLESSKTFCRDIAGAAGIPMADGADFSEVHAAVDFARRLGGPVVVKADGLAAGKGVTVCGTLAEAEDTIRAALERDVHGPAGRRVVVERALEGMELSLIAICDGEAAVALPAARDHKRLGDGDVGPNTGGMGALSPVPGVAAEAAERLVDVFHRPALREMVRRGTPFRGALYAGLMLTADGPRLLEFNVRFGDPETQAILPRLRSPIGPLLLAASQGGLAGEAEAGAATSAGLDADDQAAVAVVLAANGYPGGPATGDPIDGIDRARDRGALVFHGATRVEMDRVLTAGGRVLTVVGRGATLGEARDQAYAAAEEVRFARRHFRRDIGLPSALARATAADTQALAVAAGRR